jgi:hypothetical protein
MLSVRITCHKPFQKMRRDLFSAAAGSEKVDVWQPNRVEALYRFSKYEPGRFIRRVDHPSKYTQRDFAGCLTVHHTAFGPTIQRFHFGCT